MARKNIKQKQKQKQKQSVHVKIHIDNSNRNKKSKRTRKEKNETSNAQQPALYPQVLYVNNSLPPVQQPPMQIPVPQTLAQSMKTQAKEPVDVSAIQNTGFFEPVDETPLKTTFTPTIASSIENTPAELPHISVSGFTPENSMSKITETTIPETEFENSYAKFKKVDKIVQGKNWIEDENGLRIPKDPMYSPSLGKMWNPFTGREIAQGLKGKDADTIVEFNMMNGWI